MSPLGYVVCVGSFDNYSPICTLTTLDEALTEARRLSYNHSTPTYIKPLGGYSNDIRIRQDLDNDKTMASRFRNSRRD